MIHEIEPKKYKNEFYIMDVNDEDTIFVFFDNCILCRIENGKVIFPRYKDIKDYTRELECTFLFKIDEEKFFLLKNLNEKISDIEEYQFENIQLLREVGPKYKVFAGITAYHLNVWYRDTVYCGRCGEKLIPDTKERMMKCLKYNNMIYPRISPGIIVGIIDGDRILLTKYAGREYKKYALVAGFCEIGESLEDTVHREVKEEVGLKVKNLHFYKSQPWEYSGTLLCGFFAELDGDAEITLEEDELSEGKWISRDELDVELEDFSLTNEMMIAFKKNIFNVQ